MLPCYFCLLLYEHDMYVIDEVMCSVMSLYFGIRLIVAKTPKKEFYDMVNCKSSHSDTDIEYNTMMKDLCRT